MERYKNIIVAALIFISTVFPLYAYTSGEDRIPVVSCIDNDISVNGKIVATAVNRIYVNRIDSRVVCLSVGSSVSETGEVNIINVDPEGNEIKLSDVIKDRTLYESEIICKLNEPKIMTRDSVYTGPEVDRKTMVDVLLSYDKAMALPFIMGDENITILYTEDNGACYSVSFGYDSALIDERFIPNDGIMCSAWMTGRVGYGVAGVVKEEYSDHWAENSIRIDNYEGHTFFWFCIAYKDDKENKTYYSVIAEATDNGRQVIRSQQVDGPFVCCNIEEFSRLLDGQ